MTPKMTLPRAAREPRRIPKWWEGSGDWLLNLLLAALPFFVNTIVWFLTGPVVPTYPAVRVTDLCFFAIFLAAASIISIMKARSRDAYLKILGTCSLILIISVAVVLGFWYYPEARPQPGQPYVRFESRAIALGVLISVGAFVCSLLVQIRITKGRSVAPRKPRQMAAGAGE